MQAGSLIFLLTPLREGRRKRPTQNPYPSRFLLTPLREGRRVPDRLLVALDSISTHAPAGGATCPRRRGLHILDISTHAPAGGATIVMLERYEYDGISTHAPAGGATIRAESAENAAEFLLTPLREGRRADAVVKGTALIISTHAPAGGATAIFHKSVMRFCGKLPKDDTVLCLASFGFPRRDPKAVYLA